MKKIFIIAGEASGDLHGSNLAKALLTQDPNLEIKGWGGDKMEEAGVEVLSHYRERSLMGFLEILLNWRKIRAWFKMCKYHIADFQPDVVVLIDYGGFNLRMAKFAYNLGLRVHYYIPPKVWAWNQKRVKKLAAFTHEVSCILPFEEEWFRANGVNARYVGNPLVQTISSYTPDPDFIKNNQVIQPYIALLPGSRKQELVRILPEMVKAGRQMEGFNLVLAVAPGMDPDFYKQFDLHGIQMIDNATYDILHHSQGAIVTSGTATLETALLDVPQVVVYKANPVSFMIGKIVVKVPFISLVNLILNKKCVTELIQNEAVASKITTHLRDAITNLEMKKNYNLLREMLAGKNASVETAERILQG